MVPLINSEYLKRAHSIVSQNYILCDKLNTQTGYNWHSGLNVRDFDLSWSYILASLFQPFTPDSDEFWRNIMAKRNEDSVNGTVIKPWVGRSGPQNPAEATDSSLSKTSRLALEPNSLRFNGWQQGTIPDVHLSPPSNTEVNNGCSYTSTQLQVSRCRHRQLYCLQHG